MEYLSVAEVAKLWQMSERSVRNYCAEGRVEGAFLTGKTWNIPANAVKPARLNGSATLWEVLDRERRAQTRGGIYHRMQIDLTYNSNHIEGSRLTHDQTRYIFETNTIGVCDDTVNIDDIIETANHFRCVDYCIERAKKPLTENLIKSLHGILKGGTSDGKKAWFNVGDYKRLPNEVGGCDTVSPELVHEAMTELLAWYSALDTVTISEIIEFHARFERIHPFQDGNGRVGRLIMLKECLRYGIVPFIIDEAHKLYYYRGLHEWHKERGYLTDTCLSAQDQFKKYLDYFRIRY